MAEEVVQTLNWGRPVERMIFWSANGVVCRHDDGTEHVFETWAEAVEHRG